MLHFIIAFVLFLYNDVPTPRPFCRYAPEIVDNGSHDEIIRVAIMLSVGDDHIKNPYLRAKTLDVCSLGPRPVAAYARSAFTLPFTRLLCGRYSKCT
jgi:hypothetical protein